jgi:transposase
VYVKDFPAVQESEEELLGRLKHERDARLRLRLHLLLLIRSGLVQTRCEAAEHLTVHRNTIRNWLTRYTQGGLDALLATPDPKPKAEQKTLSEPVLKELKQRLADDGFSSYVAVQQWLHQDFGLAIPYRTVHGLVRDRLKAKLKRARPRHVKKTMPTPPRSPPS